jgi:hypothetical protein
VYSDNPAMNRKLLFFFFLFSSGALSGQYQGYHTSDFWIKYTEALTFDLKLEPLAIKKTEFTFRFWSAGQVIDIRKESNGSIRGELTCYAREYDEMNLGKRTFYSSRSPIEDDNALAIYQLILKSGLTSFPSEDAIDGWGKDADGFTYIIETADADGYSLKSYLAPVKQTSIKEANAIQSFIDKLENDLKLRKKYKIFSASIPFWCYTRGTPVVICRQE